MSSEAMLDPIEQLDAIAADIEPSHRFTARSPAALRAWQRNARAALLRCLGLHRLRKTPLNPVVESEVDRGGYIQRKVRIRSTAYSRVPLYLLLPKTLGPKHPCVLALHGHGYGVNAIVGIDEEGNYRESPAGYQQDFAVELVKRGFVVAAPEISCFGQREAGYGHLPEHSPRPSSCHNASTYAMMLGLTAAGIRVWDAMRVADYLKTVRHADAGRLGVMGISGGGMLAFFLACLDRRVKATVISGYFCDWRKSILAINHCTCNFVPGLLRVGELSDLAGLIAPHPLLVENGKHDPIFPVQDVRATVAKASAAWSLLDARDLIQEDYFEEGHKIHGVVAYPFLQQHLRRAAGPIHQHGARAMG